VLAVIIRIDDGVDDNDRKGGWWASSSGVCARRRTSMFTNWCDYKTLQYFDVEV